MRVYTAQLSYLRGAMRGWDEGLWLEEGWDEGLWLEEGWAPAESRPTISSRISIVLPHQRPSMFPIVRQ